MKNYNQKLASADDIVIQTYYKNKDLPFCSLGDVAVNSVNVPAGTVNACIGDCGSDTDYPKEELFQYINFWRYSD